MRLTNYLTEVKKKKAKKGIPKAKGKKYSFGIKSDPDDWYQKPEMMGHRWAIESLDRVEEIMNTYSKSKLQKWVIAQVWGTPEELKKNKEYTWHTFATQYTKKDAMLLQYTLRRVDKYKKNMSDLMYDIKNKAGVLKNEIIWALEHLSYVLDKEKYKEQYIRDMGWYGLQPGEADKRFEEYHKRQISKSITAYK